MASFINESEKILLHIILLEQMTHASIEEKERVALGVTDNLIRVSVGLEDVADIIEDLDNALKAVSD
jgi:cystathionine beta-lyase/cystathionine gamma-synthase